MDSQQVEARTRRLARAVRWEGAPDGAWRYMGIAHGFLEAEVQARIEAFLPGERILLVMGRRDAAEVPASCAARIVRELLMVREVSLWDPALTRTMQFSRLGIYRVGLVEAGR